MVKELLLGTAVISVLSQWTGQVNLSLGALSIFFILGILFLRCQKRVFRRQVNYKFNDSLLFI
ncbi:MAG: hypothetical protein ACLR43_03290 [Faecalibacillus faecis]